MEEIDIGYLTDLLTTSFIFGRNENIEKAEQIILKNYKLKDNINPEIEKFPDCIHYALHCFKQSRGEYEREASAVRHALESCIEPITK